MAGKARTKGLEGAERTSDAVADPTASLSSQLATRSPAARAAAAAKTSSRLSLREDLRGRGDTGLPSPRVAWLAGPLADVAAGRDGAP